MDNRVFSAGGFVFGGLLIGAWLYFLLFTAPRVDIEKAPWALWGTVGLVVAGGLLGARFAPANLRMAIWVGVGVGVGLLAMAAMFNQVVESMAAILTIGGGAMIVTSIPGEPQPDPAAQPWQTAAEETVPAKSTPRKR